MTREANTEHLTVRPASIDEIDLLRLLHTSFVWSKAMRGHALEAVEAYLEAMPGVDEAMVREGRYFVAESDGEIVAAGGWAAADAEAREGLADTLLPGRTAVVRGFFVLECLNGLGRRLIRCIEQNAVRAGYAMTIFVASANGASSCVVADYRAASPMPLATKEGPVVTLQTFTKHIGTSLAA